METAIDTKPVVELAEDQFFEIWRRNCEMRVERDAEGEIRIVPSAEGTSTMETGIDTKPVVDLTEGEFFEFCQRTHDVRIVRNAKGEILKMPPAGGATSHRNAELTTQLQLWAKRDGTGIVFDSSG